ncbi:MAG TPA: hypothetical protein VJ895_00340 [Candidatus Nanoarchaeia archaeon]|nr:hypothetical protein [Candidatus Nanoarchaeia archaeon]
MKKTKELFHELKHHAPFTLSATILAIAVVITIKYFISKSFDEEAFEILHPLHVIASAIVSAGIFYKYKPKIISSILVGVISAIVIGSLSDIIFPFLIAGIFNLHPHFHLPIIENTIIILGAAIFGGTIGAITKTTKISHLIHVGLSVFASLFYLLAFSQTQSIIGFTLAIIIIFISVIIPCCISDILLPFFFLGKKIKQCNCHSHKC